MAICKILYMKDCGSKIKGKHLYAALEYISDLEKTQQGKLISAINCQPDFAFSQMMDTKKYFGKIDKRQGYHLIISFQEGEVDADTAFEITERFAKEYLGEKYEAVYAVHDNTEHIHSHIVFNSVSFLDGKKYHYKKGDWAKFIQPITNRLCREYGISTIEIEGESTKEDLEYPETKSNRKGQVVWSHMIRRDVDACILQADTFQEFLELLKERGYNIKQNKYLAIMAPGMKRYSRLKSLGDEYTEERIRERILTEQVSSYQAPTLEETERIIYSQIPYGKRAKLSRLQKRYYAKLYRIGLLKQKPYSKAWKYRDEIKQMGKLQRQYLFLVENQIESVEELQQKLEELLKKRDEVFGVKRKEQEKRKRWQKCFRIQTEMKVYRECEDAYQLGDDFFLEEHQKWEKLNEKLKENNTSYEEVCLMKGHFKSKLKQLYLQEKNLSKEIYTIKTILTDMEDEAQDRQLEEREKRLERKQPTR